MARERRAPLDGCVAARCNSTVVGTGLVAVGGGRWWGQHGLMWWRIGHWWGLAGGSGDKIVRDWVR